MSLSLGVRFGCFMPMFDESWTQVFSVQRVQKKFNARRSCLDRTYEVEKICFICSQALITYMPYRALMPLNDCLIPLSVIHLQYYLPAHLLLGTEVGTATPSSTTPDSLDHQEFEAIMGWFRAALNSFIGTHAFQNYTSGAGRRRAASAASARRPVSTRGGEG